MEIKLHDLIRDTLTQEYSNDEAGWWCQGIPGNLRIRCHEWHERDVDESRKPYCYTDQLDLYTIIENQQALFNIYSLCIP